LVFGMGLQLGAHSRLRQRSQRDHGHLPICGMIGNSIGMWREGIIFWMAVPVLLRVLGYLPRQGQRRVLGRPASEIP
jgi:hypothetical protein